MTLTSGNSGNVSGTSTGGTTGAAIATSSGNTTSGSTGAASTGNTSHGGTTGAATGTSSGTSAAHSGAGGASGATGSGDQHHHHRLGQHGRQRHLDRNRRLRQRRFGRLHGQLRSVVGGNSTVGTITAAGVYGTGIGARAPDGVSAGGLGG